MRVLAGQVREFPKSGLMDSNRKFAENLPLLHLRHPFKVFLHCLPKGKATEFHYFIVKCLSG